MTLATIKQQKVASYVLMNPNRHVQLGLNKHDAHLGHDEPSPPHDPLEVPEHPDPFFPGQTVIRPETILASRLVPHVQPLVLYVSGSKSPVCRDGTHERFAKATGTGYSGSGGILKCVCIEDVAHTSPQEKPGSCAELLAPWIK